MDIKRELQKLMETKEGLKRYLELDNEVPFHNYVEYLKWGTTTVPAGYNLDFTTDKYAKNGKPVSLVDMATFTRDSEAAYMDGAIQKIAKRNEPILLAQGLLLRPADVALSRAADSLLVHLRNNEQPTGTWDVGVDYSFVSGGALFFGDGYIQDMSKEPRTGGGVDEDRTVREFDFITGVYKLDGISIPLDGVGEFERAGDATMITGGQMVLKSAGEPRILGNGLMLEPASENLAGRFSWSPRGAWTVESYDGSDMLAIAGGSEVTDRPRSTSSVFVGSGLFSISTSYSTNNIDVSFGAFDTQGSLVDHNGGFRYKSVQLAADQEMRPFIGKTGTGAAYFGRIQVEAGEPTSYIHPSSGTTREAEYFKVPYEEGQVIGGVWSEGITHEIVGDFAVFSGHGFIEKITMVVEGSDGETPEPLYPPAPPTNLLFSTDGSMLTGKGEIASIVSVANSIGTVLATGVVSGSGTFGVFLTPPLINREMVSVTLANEDGKSAPTTIRAPKVESGGGTSVPAKEFDFVSNTYKEDGSSVSLDMLGTYTRGSEATDWVDNVLVDYGVNEPRITSEGLLIEPRLINYFRHNEDLNGIAPSARATLETLPDAQVGTLIRLTANTDTDFSLMFITHLNSSSVGENLKTILVKKGMCRYINIKTPRTRMGVTFDMQEKVFTYIRDGATGSFKERGEWIEITITDFLTAANQVAFAFYAGNILASDGEGVSVLEGEYVDIAYPLISNTSVKSSSVIKAQDANKIRAAGEFRFPVTSESTVMGDWDEGISYEIVGGEAIFSGNGHIRDIIEESDDGVVVPPVEIPKAPLALSITSDGITVSGSGEVGAVVSVKVGGGEIATGIVSALGAFELTLEPPKTQGEVLSITLTNSAGTSPPATITAPFIGEGGESTSYGLTWDSVNDTYTRVGQSNFTEVQELMRMCVLNVDGSVNYYLNPTDITKKLDGSPSDLFGGDGDVMVEIPKFYYNMRTSGTLKTAEVSLHASSGLTLHPAFVKAGVEVDYRYMRAYKASESDGVLRSVSGVAALRRTDRATYRDMARAKGEGWQLIDWNLRFALGLLVFTEAGTFRADTVFGVGRNSGATYGRLTGVGDAWGGGSTQAGESTNVVKYRGIEDLWGLIYEFTDGLTIVDRVVYACQDHTKYTSGSPDENYEDIGVTLPDASGVYIKDMDFNMHGFFPISGGGTATTFVGDGMYTDDGTVFASTGGSAGTVAGGGGVFGGMFCMAFNSNASRTGDHLGTGICF